MSAHVFDRRASESFVTVLSDCLITQKEKKLKFKLSRARRREVLQKNASKLECSAEKELIALPSVEWLN